MENFKKNHRNKILDLVACLNLGEFEEYKEHYSAIGIIRSTKREIPDFYLKREDAEKIRISADYSKIYKEYPRDYKQYPSLSACANINRTAQSIAKDFLNRLILPEIENFKELRHKLREEDAKAIAALPEVLRTLEPLNLDELPTFLDIIKQKKILHPQNAKINEISLYHLANLENSDYGKSFIITVHSHAALRMILQILVDDLKFLKERK